MKRVILSGLGLELTVNEQTVVAAALQTEIPNEQGLVRKSLTLSMPFTKSANKNLRQKRNVAKRVVLSVILALGLGLFHSSVFAQNEVSDTVMVVSKKHRQFDHHLGFQLSGAGMNMNPGAIYTANVGMVYDFYVLDWLSLNAGLLFHQEVFHNRAKGDKQIGLDGNPFCFTIPLGFHFNIPKADWLYAGVNFAWNIPMFDAKQVSERNVYAQDDVFFSLPIDFGVDLRKPDGRGSKLFLRFTPTFHKGGTVVPVGLTWQINFWKIKNFVAPQPTVIYVPQPVVVPVVVPR